MDTFISIVIAGFAAGYVVELASSLLEWWVSPKLVKQIITLPLSLAALWTLGINGWELFVYTPAAGFVSLVVLLFVSRPIEVNQIIGRR